MAHVTARVDPAEEARAVELLPPRARPLFLGMPVADRRHALQVTARLLVGGRPDVDVDVVAAALLHDVGRIQELDRGPLYLPTAEGKLLGHVHLGLRMIEERSGALASDVRAELLHAVAVHHESRGARTAEAAVLYHANQLDAVAATRPVDA